MSFISLNDSDIEFLALSQNRGPFGAFTWLQITKILLLKGFKGVEKENKSHLALCHVLNISKKLSSDEKAWEITNFLCIVASHGEQGLIRDKSLKEQ